MGKCTFRGSPLVVGGEVVGGEVLTFLMAWSIYDIQIIPGATQQKKELLERGQRGWLFHSGDYMATSLQLHKLIKPYSTVSYCSGLFQPKGN